MRRLAEKLALVAQICITAVFVLIAVCVWTGAVSPTTVPATTATGADGIVLILMFVLAAIYVALSAYVLFVNFSPNQNLKRILLFCDSTSATHTNMKVIRNIVKDCSRRVEGLSVRKVRVRSDEKNGLVATVSVRAHATNVSEAVNTLRCLVTDGFQNTLGLKFNTVNFTVDRLHGKYLPDADIADRQAQTLQQKQDEIAQNYHQPLDEDNTDLENSENADKTT